MIFRGVLVNGTSNTILVLNNILYGVTVPIIYSCFDLCKIKLVSTAGNFQSVSFFGSLISLIFGKAGEIDST